MEEMTAERLIEATLAILKAAEYCFLITLAGSEPPQARLMMPFDPEEDLTIWMAASPVSRKVRELQADSRATLSYPLPQDGAYATLLGTATIEDSLELRRRYWRRRFVQFWPGGPESDDYLLIRFVPSRIELMNVAAGIVPEPYGLRAAILLRDDESFLVSGDG
jgi:general stress protein 26